MFLLMRCREHYSFLSNHPSAFAPIRPINVLISASEDARSTENVARECKI